MRDKRPLPHHDSYFNNEPGTERQQTLNFSNHTLRVTQEVSSSLNDLFCCKNTALSLPRLFSHETKFRTQVRWSHFKGEIVRKVKTMKNFNLETRSPNEFHHIWADEKNDKKGL